MTYQIATANVSQLQCLILRQTAVIIEQLPCFNGNSKSTKTTLTRGHHHTPPGPPHNTIKTTGRRGAYPATGGTQATRQPWATPPPKPEFPFLVGVPCTCFGLLGYFRKIRKIEEPFGVRGEGKPNE